MRWFSKTAITAGFAAGLLAGGYAHAQDFTATLNGFNEVGGVGAAQTSAILSGGTGTLHLQLDRNIGAIGYSLSYGGALSSTVTAAHIHFAKPGVGGGILVFLCANTPPAGVTTPICPPAPTTGMVTVTGTLTAANVQAIAGQNVPAGDFAALTAALASGTAYGNIHTTNFPAGEVRGQIHAAQSGGGGGGDGDGDGDGHGGGHGGGNQQ